MSLAIRLSLLLLAATAIAAAQQPKTAVINLQGALLATKAGQKAIADMDAKASKKKQSLAAQQNEIEGLKDKLAKGANVLDEEALQALSRTIDDKTTLLKRAVEDAQSELQQDEQRILQQLGQKILRVINKYAQDHGFGLVINADSPPSAVLYASEALNITKDVVAAFDKTE